MKVRTISANEEIGPLVDAVNRSAQRALDQIVQNGADKRGIQRLWSMKFSPVGCDPLDAEIPLNLIEQLNQTFTYLATAKALEILFEFYPEFAPFTINLGTASGFDVESVARGGLAAEVFAAVKPSNNRKLSKDIAKLNRAGANVRVVFFMCPGYEKGRQVKLEQDGVQVWSVGGEL